MSVCPRNAWWCINKIYRRVCYVWLCRYVPEVHDDVLTRYTYVFVMIMSVCHRSAWWCINKIYRRVCYVWLCRYAPEVHDDVLACFEQDTRQISLFVCVNILTHSHIIRMYVCIYIYIYMHEQTYIHTHTFVCVCVYIYIYIYIRTYTNTHIHTHVCAHTYIHTYTHIQKPYTHIHFRPWTRRGPWKFWRGNCY